jgi:cytochrome c oxidase subunit 2
MSRVKLLVLLTIFVLSGAVGASAQEQSGDITNWIDEPATPLAEDVRSNFFLTLALILPFLLLAEGLLIYVIIKFRKRPGREPAKFHENVRLEIAWTIAPAIVLVIIALSTYSLIERINYAPQSDMTVEVTAQRFFWKYHYPEHDITIAEEPLVVPEDTYVTLLGTSMDVIHAWWVPAFGVKKDFMPGRITELWFKARKGTYKGQCAELCGPLHADMLIDVEVVSEDEFEDWIAQKKAELQQAGSVPVSGDDEKGDESSKQQAN